MFTSKTTTQDVPVDMSNIIMMLTGLTDYVSNNRRGAKCFLMISPEFFGNQYVNPEKATRTLGLVTKEAGITTDMFDYISSYIVGKSLPIDLSQIELARHGSFPNIWYTLDGIEFKDDNPFENAAGGSAGSKK